GQWHPTSGRHRTLGGTDLGLVRSVSLFAINHCLTANWYDAEAMPAEEILRLVPQGRPIGAIESSQVIHRLDQVTKKNGFVPFGTTDHFCSPDVLPSQRDLISSTPRPAGFPWQ